jgi:hypothetical protein
MLLLLEPVLEDLEMGLPIHPPTPSIVTAGELPSGHPIPGHGHHVHVVGVPVIQEVDVVSKSQVREISYIVGPRATMRNKQHPSI